MGVIASRQGADRRETRLIHRLIEAQGEQTPNAVALRMDAVRVTYDQLAARGRGIAHRLGAMGIQPGDRIAYLGKNDPRLIELLVAASIGGFVLVPLNWRLAETELDAVLSISRPRVLVLSRDLQHGLNLAAIDLVFALDDAGVERLSFAELTKEIDAPFQEIAADEDRVVIQLYTSGTTGLPKGVMLTHRNFLALRDPALGPLADCEHPGSDEVALVALPMFHVAGIAAVLSILCTGCGGTVILQRDFNVGEYSALLASDAVTRLCLVPAMLRTLLDAITPEHCRSPRLRYILYGASPITNALLTEARARFNAGLVQVYGLTETAGYVTMLTPQEHHSEDPLVINSIGRPIPGAEVKIVDSQGSALPEGETGEIWVRAGANMAGYFERPDETRAALTEDGWLRTGDAGCIGPLGHIVLKDRIKNLIISGGENIYPSEVENAIASCPGVADVAVIGVPDVRWGEVPKAFVVRRTQALDEQTVLDWTLGRIARFKAPKSVVFVDSLPRNPSGKVLHRVLREAEAQP